ncbi:MAG: hypothetical protein AAF565_06415 [Pseudomonadota bacterium]
MLTLLVNWITQLIEERRQREILRGLLQKDDRLLDDIGINRQDVIDALGYRVTIDRPRHAITLTEHFLGMHRTF